GFDDDVDLDRAKVSLACHGHILSSKTRRVLRVKKSPELKLGLVSSLPDTDVYG
ncbi:MAG: hypothetical protein RL672_788, partial [Actinomycetota bacterium]